MKSVFTFILAVLVILSCGKTNSPSTAIPIPASVDTEQESTSQRKTADPDAKLEDYSREIILSASADPDAKPEDYSEYLSPEQSMQWLKQNGFKIEKQYSGRYILTYTGSGVVIIRVDRRSTALVPSRITLENLEVVLAVDTNNNIRVKSKR